MLTMGRSYEKGYGTDEVDMKIVDLGTLVTKIDDSFMWLICH
jgi:hypothetical protein